jgi:hypothetical protein
MYRSGRDGGYDSVRVPEDGLWNHDELRRRWLDPYQVQSILLGTTGQARAEALKLWFSTWYQWRFDPEALAEVRTYRAPTHLYLSARLRW